MNETEIASQIFKQYGLSMKTATRAGGWTNAVWFNNDVVLRLSLTRDSDRIRKEVQLSRMLPESVGYPVNISTGVIEGYEWSLSKRIKGINLSEAWPRLSWVERTDTIKQLWSIMQAIHTVEVETVKDISSDHPWYSTLDSDDILSRYKVYVEKEIFTSEQGAALSEIIMNFMNKLPTAKLVLNHGDITMDNILWNEGKIVSLIDFEHSVIAPAEIDLNSFINLSLFSEEGNGLSDVTNSEEFQQYKFEVKELIHPVLYQPDCIDFLIGYAILLSSVF